MLRIVYNALWYPALPFALAAAGARNKQDRRERMGSIVPAPDGDGPRIWIHASSVGEIEAVRPVAMGLHRELEGARMVITTMTTSGRDAARRRIPHAALCALAPLDCPAIVRKFLRRVRPRVVLIGETELWPNYFIESRKTGARVAIINGRISERSLARYRKAGSLFGRALRSANLILAQTEADAHRFAALGVSASQIAVTGNTKLDFSLIDKEVDLRDALARFTAGRTIMVAGSTARGEEAVVLEAWQTLRERFPELVLVIAPRHPARASEVIQALHAASIPFVRASSLDYAGEADVLLLDTIGELRAVYSRAAIAFVGGSMIAGRGGQNIAEPAAMATPVLFGPYHENQRQMAEALLGAGGAAVVDSASSLADQCARWLGDDALRRDAGARAKAAVDSASGATRATVEHLCRLAANSQ